MVAMIAKALTQVGGQLVVGVCRLDIPEKLARDISSPETLMFKYC